MQLFQNLKDFFCVMLERKKVTFMKIIVAMIICLNFVTGEAEGAELYDVIYNNVYSGNRNEAESQWITDAIMYASAAYEVDPILITAIMEAESSFRLDSFSRVGAIGLMQLMPETARSLGVNPYNALENILGGVIYLGNQIKRFASWGEYGVTYAVAAYNAGPGAGEKFGGVPNYAETQNYVVVVARNYNRILNQLNG